jgi:hypothetical protein
VANILFFKSVGGRVYQFTEIKGKRQKNPVICNFFKIRCFDAAYKWSRDAPIVPSLPVLHEVSGRSIRDWQAWHGEP